MGSGSIAPSFLTSAPDGCERSASRPFRFNPGEKVPGAHWTAGWVGPSAGVKSMEKRKIFPLPGFEKPAVQHVARH
jgi:hypothetical protein